jgi:Zn-finger nucleic acid-binding protein
LPPMSGRMVGRGELDKIIDRSAQDLQSAAPARTGFSQPQYDQRSHGSHGRDYGHGKRKKSFLENLFD